LNGISMRETANSDPKKSGSSERFRSLRTHP
jgi:hypothetical protein